MKLTGKIVRKQIDKSRHLNKNYVNALILILILISLILVS